MFPDISDPAEGPAERLAVACLPLGAHSSILHFQRPTQVPWHQHPAVFHPKHIAMHDCSCLAWTWQQQFYQWMILTVNCYSRCWSNSIRLQNEKAIDRLNVPHDCLNRHSHLLLCQIIRDALELAA